MDYPDAISEAGFTTRGCRFSLVRVCGAALIAVFILLGATASHASCSYAVSAPSLGIAAAGGNLPCPSKPAVIAPGRSLAYPPG